jgi:transposase
MIEPDTRKAIYLLHKEGMPIRELSRRLKISRNTVRDIIRLKGEVPASARADTIHIDPGLLEELHKQCEGYKQRIHEKLVEEKKVQIKYSTLTRKVRQLGLGRKKKDRCDQVPDEPGAEMQHDTSPYTVKLSGTKTKVIASLIYLRYSKRRYLRFYRTFNRFTMKCFFHEALMFWGYVAPISIIDNTNLARLRGTGSNAVIVPEMAAFAKRYGFEFVCHERGHSNRKAGEERGFFTVETNFFPGRTFKSLEDLNQQAFEWATDRMYHRALTKAKIIPAKAFEHERVYLTELPSHLPAPYLVLTRSTDEYGYAAFAANYYWVPGTDREDVKVLQYSDHLKIYRGRELLAEYRLPPDGIKNERFSPEGYPKPRYQPKNRRKSTAEEEKRLRAMGEVVSAYLDFALKPKGIQRHRFVRELFALTRQMSSALFLSSIERALKYRITSIETIQRIARLYVHQGDETLPCVEVDETYRNRDAYQEGRLTDEPDFSPYDELLEDTDG